jgi:tripartite-type tricarboxylate transporter receptor subunit TctC
MNLARRRFLHLAASVAAVPSFTRMTVAQTYPTRPVRWIVGYPAGGSADLVARLIGQHLAERLSQPIVIENRPGAGNNLATEAVVRAAADGYTLLLVNPANTINAALYDNLSFNFLQDIAPVAGVMRVPNVAVVHPSVPAETIAAFIAHAKANPGKINMASSGNGVPSHVAGELFKLMAGIDMVHVPYRGSAPALTDLLGGQVQVMFDPLPSSIDHIRTGRLRALAVTTATRSDVIPDVPAVGEFLPGYEASTWFGVGVPKKTPVQIVNGLNTEINAILGNSKTKARLADMGGTVLAGSPADFQKLIAAETDKWSKVIRFAGIKAS